MAKHFVGGMADKFEFIFISAIDSFHHGGEGMAAGVRGIGMDLGVIDLMNRIVQSAVLQDSVEDSSVLFDIQGVSVYVAEDRAGDFVMGKAVNDRLDDRWDGDDAVFARIGFRAAGEGFFLAVIEAGIEGDKLGWAETEVALAEDIIGIRDFADVIFNNLNIIIWECSFCSMFAGDDQIRRQV